MKYYNVRLFGIITYFTEDKVMEFIPSWILKNHGDLWDYLKRFNEKAAEEFFEDRVENYFGTILSRYYEH